ncbi:cell wall-binding repeat-containing protein [Candidatus Poriferisodalis sp.]|uniref:cell wall-binding repeat-containing protein n=1 Tax=Candidatus Poriferisodalis sp. TaxID=3101277 RepID=UPI003B017370
MNTRKLTRVLAAVAVAVLVAALTPAVASAQSNSPESSDAVARLWGQDRYATSLAVAEAVAEHAGGSLSTAVLVAGRSWTDAVTAAPLAGTLNAPVLLADPRDGVTEDTKAFMKRVGISRLVVVGSTQTLPVTALSGLSDIDSDVERITAANKYEASVAVAEAMGTPARLGSGYGQTVILASGEVFADALSAGPLGADKGIPILLTTPDELHPTVKDYIAANADHVIIMGGPAAISGSAESAVARIKRANEPSTDMAVSRVGGRDRFETATLFADFIEGASAEDGCFDGTVAGLATGGVPADAFSAAPLLARLCAPLVLTGTDRLSEATAIWLRHTEKLYVFGGTAAVSEAAVNAWMSPVMLGGTDIPWEPCGKHIAAMEEVERKFYAHPIFADGHLSVTEAGLYQEGSKRMLEATWAIGADATRDLRTLTIALIEAADRLIDSCPADSEPNERIRPMLERAQAHTYFRVNQGVLRLFVG